METPHQLRMNETVEDAISDDIKAIGGPKKAAELFFPDKNPETAANTVRCWSLANRNERPEPSQLFMLIEASRKAIGFSEVSRFIEQRLNCRIDYLSPEDEKAKLQREFVTAVDRLASIQARLDINEQRTVVAIRR